MPEVTEEKKPKRSEWEIKEDISAMKRVREIVLDKERLGEVKEYVKNKEAMEESLQDGDISKALGLS